MAQVVFLTGVVDAPELALRLVRKKHREGGRVVVCGPDFLLDPLGAMLWQHEETSFLPHLRQPAADGDWPPDSSLALTRVWLLNRPQDGLRCDSVINLGLDDFGWLTGFERIAEVVGSDAQLRASGRARWKRYEAEGHTLVHRPQSP